MVTKKRASEGKKKKRGQGNQRDEHAKGASLSLSPRPLARFGKGGRDQEKEGKKKVEEQKKVGAFLSRAS